MRSCSLLLALLLALVSGSALARSRNLTSSQCSEVRRQIRAQAQFQFALFEGRRPSLHTTIRKIPGARDQFRASATITGLWQGARTTLAENQFSISRARNGKLTVTSPRPFIPLR